MRIRLRAPKTRPGVIVADLEHTTLDTSEHPEPQVFATTSNVILTVFAESSSHGFGPGGPEATGSGSREHIGISSD